MKKKSVRSLALLMAAAMTGSTFFGTSIPVKAADETWVSDEELQENGTEAPEPDTVLPDANQYRYQKEELAAFCHFGPNTFNNTEWGDYGDKPAAEVFTLTQDFDAETLVNELKEAGFKKLIVTAKHHDGFCIWNSAYTEFDVAATNYKSGQGDILEEISKACTEANMDMGLYLSPWDVNASSYGYYDAEGNALLDSKGNPKDNMAWEDVYAADAEDYNEYYNNQLIEILSSNKYGNDGKFVEVWMDGAKGAGSAVQNYDFLQWFETIQKYEGIEAGRDADCMLFGAEAYTTVRWIGNEDGSAARNTWSKSMVNKELNTIDSNKQGSHYIGLENGNQWTVPEADARITSGWFWAEGRKTPKSIEALGTMYFDSVGHNATLLLNVPPNDQGKVDEAILERVREFGKNIKETFASNMAAEGEAEVTASEVRGGDTAFKPGNTVDGNDETYWTTNDETNEGSLLINLGSAKKVDVISIEEAIQNGQRINEYKVEYRNGSGNWIVLEEGETIGAKRLVRIPAVTATEVKITVATPTGKVPMISEVGVYKATKDFELAAAAPTGMGVIDITDKDRSDGKGFAFQGTWNNQTGSEYVNETNTWANQGASLTLEFNGSKVYLVGTKDPNHGKATIRIDGGDPITVNTQASSRSTGQVWFSSDDLTDGPHTLTLTVDSAAIGIEAAYVINNGGVGMIGLEAEEYTMNEDQTMSVKVTRVGGTTGRIKALLSPNPGTAIQGDFDTNSVVVTLADGQKEVTVPITTRRNIDQTGTRDFTIELNSPSTDLIIGFIDTAKVSIIDAESMTKDRLQELVTSVEGWTKEMYTGDWNTFADALESANGLLAEPSPDALEMGKAYTALENAKSGLSNRTQFTEEDPVVFPVKKDESVIAEAEFLTLSRKEGVAEDKNIQIRENASASNGHHVGWFIEGSNLTMNYKADVAGIYTVRITYASGRDTGNANDITFSGDKIEETTQQFSRADANDQGTVLQTKEFDLKVNQVGAGTITMSTAGGGPNVDKIEIVAKDIPNTYDVNASASDGGKIDPVGTSSVVENGEVTYTITPDAGYEISKVLVGGEDKIGDVAIGDNGVGTYTLADVAGNTTIAAEFELVNYTESNRFQFPGKVNESVTLEAEKFILTNIGGDNETYKLEISKATPGDDGWPSNGKFVNSLNQGDKISVPYVAEKSGTYKVTVTYRSGSPNNSLMWSTEPEGLIKGEDGNNTAAASGVVNGEGITRTLDFNITVTKPGAGVWIFTGPEGNSPQLDKFDIVLTNETGTFADELYKVDLEIAIQDAKKEIVKEDTYTAETIEALKEALNVAVPVFEAEAITQAEVDRQLEVLSEAIEGLKVQTFAINTSVESGVGGTIEANKTAVERGESVVLTITPKLGYTAASLKINDVEADGFYGPNGSYTISDITADQDIVVNFAKTGYTEEEPFEFPTEVNVANTTTLEAEYFTLTNVGGDGEKWKLEIKESNPGTDGWPSNGKFVNSLNQGDKISIPYVAEKSGIYTVTATYRSGSPGNQLAWSSDGNINSGSVSAGASNANVTNTTEEFEVVVTKAGPGVWTFTAPSGNSPQLDKFEIKLKEEIVNPEEYTVTVDPTDSGSVIVDKDIVADGDSVSYTVTANGGYEIDTLTINGEVIAAAAGKASYGGIVENVKGNVTISAVFKASDPVQPENPDKTALWSALQEAYAILAQVDKYSAASLAEYKAVVDEVYAVYESGTATADAIAQAIARLGEAKNLLAGAANPGTGGVGNSTTGNPSDTQKPSGNSTDNGKAVNTGDVSSPMLWIAVLVAACLAGGVVIRSRVNKSEKK